MSRKLNGELPLLSFFVNYFVNYYMPLLWAILWEHLAGTQPNPIWSALLHYWTCSHSLAGPDQWQYLKSGWQDASGSADAQHSDGQPLYWPASCHWTSRFLLASRALPNFLSLSNLKQWPKSCLNLGLLTKISHSFLWLQVKQIHVINLHWGAKAFASHPYTFEPISYLWGLCNGLAVPYVSKKSPAGSDPSSLIQDPFSHSDPPATSGKSTARDESPLPPLLPCYWYSDIFLLSSEVVHSHRD